MKILAVLAALSICGAVLGQSHQAVRDQLFADADTAKAAADDHNARVLAPTSYAAGMEHYIEAAETLEKGKDVNDVRTELVEAKAQFERARDSAQLAEATFANVLTARAAAERAEAAKFAARLWERAEAELVAAAEDLENGKLKKAADDAIDIERSYRDTEARAISERTRAGN